MHKSQVILDPSIAIYAVIICEQTPVAFGLMEKFRALHVTLFAPRLWGYEVVCGINKYRHVNLISLHEAEKAVDRVTGLGVTMIDETPAFCKSALHWAARLQRMAAYDSFYLALTESLSAEFWTADKRLANAINVSWVHYITGGA